MQLRITIAMCIVEIRNRKSLQSKVNICKSDVKIGDYADSLLATGDSVIRRVFANRILYCAKQTIIFTFISHVGG